MEKVSLEILSENENGEDFTDVIRTLIVRSLYKIDNLTIQQIEDLTLAYAVKFNLSKKQFFDVVDYVKLRLIVD